MRCIPAPLTPIAVALLLAGGLALPSAAAPVKGADGSLYVDGLTPNSRAVLNYASGQRSVNVNSDACGRITLRNSSSTPLTGVATVLLDGTSIALAGLPTDNISRCINGVAEVAHPANFRLPDNSIVFVGQTPLSAHAVAFPGVALSRQATVNSCGFLRLTTSAQYPLAGGLTVNGGANLDYATIATANPPRCINNVLYVPSVVP